MSLRDPVSRSRTVFESETLSCLMDPCRFGYSTKSNLLKYPDPCVWRPFGVNDLIGEGRFGDGTRTLLTPSLN